MGLPMGTEGRTQVGDATRRWKRWGGRELDDEKPTRRDHELGGGSLWRKHPNRMEGIARGLPGQPPKSVRGKGPHSHLGRRGAHHHQGAQRDPGPPAQTERERGREREELMESRGHTGHRWTKTRTFTLNEAGRDSSSSKLM